jgi:hypothetical protein
MKTIAPAVVTVAILTLTGLTGAGIGSPMQRSDQACHRPERRSTHYDERCPQHDGDGSILVAPDPANR